MDRLPRHRIASLMLLALLGCPASPEDGRVRGGGPGGDGGNYEESGVAVPSKLDGSRDLHPLLRASR
jgi:hypothetical protein